MLHCSKSTLRSLDEELCVWLLWTNSCQPQWLKREHQLYPLFSHSGSSDPINKWIFTKDNRLCWMIPAGGLQLAGHNLQGVVIWCFSSHKKSGAASTLQMCLAHVWLLAGQRWYKHKMFLMSLSTAIHHPRFSENLEASHNFCLKKNGPQKPPQRFATIIVPPSSLVNLT